MAARHVRGRLFPRHGWRLVRLGCLEIRLPGGWGDPEVDPGGGFVIHNRPRRFRVDGDAVWYASAIELRIAKTSAAPPAAMAPMRVTCRTVKCPEGPVRLMLFVANGVGPPQRRVAELVLNGVRTLDEGLAIDWPEEPPAHA